MYIYTYIYIHIYIYSYTYICIYPHTCEWVRRHHIVVHIYIYMAVAQGSGALVYGATNSNVCPSGSVAITDAATCQELTVAHGLAFVVSGSLGSLPIGCFKDGSHQGTDSYFNTHPTGAAHSDYMVVCKAPGLCFWYFSVAIARDMPPPYNCISFICRVSFRSPR